MNDAMEIINRHMGVEPLLQQRDISSGCHLAHYRCYVDDRVLPATHEPLLFIHLEGIQINYHTANNSQLATSSSGVVTLLKGDQQTEWQVNGTVNFIVLTLPENMRKTIYDTFEPSQESVSFSDAISYSLGSGLLAQLCRSEGDHVYQQFLLQSLYTQLHYITSQTAAHPDDKRGKKNQTIDRVLHYIDSHLGDELSSSTLAAVANLSGSHFRDCFSCYVGSSPHQYILRRRLQRAEFLLLERVLSISAIAADLGFSSQSHFGSCFKKQYGVTPSQFAS